jgi:hypothetical protein
MFSQSEAQSDRASPTPGDAPAEVMRWRLHQPRRSDAKPMRPAKARRQTMRVMVLVKATDDSEKGILPTTAAMEAMGRFADLMMSWSQPTIMGAP